MVRKFIVDSLAYWVSEYGVDGFRFDLMALIDLDTMLAVRDRLRQINPSVLLYGEPWAGGQAAGLAHLTDKQAVRGTGLGAFNDDFRDAIKGDRNDGPPGFIQNGDRLDRVRRGVQGALDDSALNPADAITYCEAHDDLTTWDKLLQSASDAPEALKKRMQRLAGLLVLTSQGMSFLDGGQEFCRSKGGNHNSYNAPDAVNQYDWSLKKANADVFAYYRGLIALRKAHPVFRLRSGDDVRKRLQFLRSAPASRCLVYQLDGRALPGETWTTVLVLLNGEAADQTFALPPGTWKVVADADRAGVEPLVEAAKEVKGRAALGDGAARVGSAVRTRAGHTGRVRCGGPKRAGCHWRLDRQCRTICFVGRSTAAGQNPPRQVGGRLLLVREFFLARVGGSWRTVLARFPVLRRQLCREHSSLRSWRRPWSCCF